MEWYLENLGEENPVLLRIPEPPKSYIDLLIWVGVEERGETHSSPQQKFYNKFPTAKKENWRFLNSLHGRREKNLLLLNQRNPKFFMNYKSTGEGLHPIERIERRGFDGKKHGDIWTMLIWDFGCKIIGKKEEIYKIYIPLYGGGL